eukprot:2308313-Alexandrium_andersonii.AAC.1
MRRHLGKSGHPLAANLIDASTASRCPWPASSGRSATTTRLHQSTDLTTAKIQHLTRPVGNHAWGVNSVCPPNPQTKPRRAGLT